jgi:hypothetical protein
MTNRPTTLPVNDPGSDAAAPACEMSGMLRAQLNRCCYCRQFYPTAGHNYKKYCFNLALLPAKHCRKLQCITAMGQGKPRSWQMRAWRQEKDEGSPGHARQKWMGAAAILSFKASAKSFALELYFSSSRVALIHIAATFGVDCLPIQPRNFSFSESGPWRDRSSAQSANVIIKPNFPL